MARNKNKGKANKAADKTKKTTSNRNLPLPDAPPSPRKRPSSDHPSKREPLKQLSSGQANVAISRKNTKGPKSPDPVTMERVLYQTKDSVERLERVGFDSRVTSLSPGDVVERWYKTGQTQSHKSRANSESGPKGHKTRTITSAPLTLSSDFCTKNRERIDFLLPTPVPEGLERHVSNVQTRYATIDGRDSAIGSDVASEPGPESNASGQTEASGALVTGDPSASETGQPDAESASSREPQSPGAVVARKTLADVFAVPELGSMILEEVFATGFHNVQKLSMTSLKFLGLVRTLLVIMDCTGGGLASMGADSKMLLAVSPQVTIEDFRVARDRDPLGLHDFNFLKGWFHKALKEESIVIRDLAIIAHAGSLRFRATVPTVNIIMPLKMRWDDDIFVRRRIVCGEDNEIWQPQIQREARNLRNLLTHVYKRRGTLAHIHFHEVPLVDRRVVAAILRVCPSITTVSIDACPLLHIGDLLPIIDEIHAINAERDDASKITSLNFGPIFERGMPEFVGPMSATYGLTWDAIRFDVAQVGLYAILLKAFMKASAMGLKTLFDEDGALMQFLLKLPLDPLGIPIFLDACYRLKDRHAVTNDLNDVQLRKIVYDMLRVVRIGFAWPKSINASMDFFNGEMMNNKKYCKCCGYVLLDAFFFELNHVSEERAQCFGCMLQCELDAQSHHLRKEKLECLNVLFPSHKPNSIGPEAPVCDTPVLVLKSTLPTSAGQPTATLNPQTGDIETRVDPRKRREDSRASLVGVGSSTILFEKSNQSKKLWERFFLDCHKLDMFRTAAATFCDAVDDEKIDRALAMQMYDTHMVRIRPDHRKERQLRFGDTSMSCNTHPEARKNHLAMSNNGEMPRKILSLLHETELAELKKAQEDAFW